MIADKLNKTDVSIGNLVVDNICGLVKVAQEGWEFARLFAAGIMEDELTGYKKIVRCRVKSAIGERG